MTAHPTPTSTEPNHDVRERVRAVLVDAARHESFEGTDIDHLTDAVLAAVSAAVPMTTTPPPEGTTEPRCEHTEHATRGDGRYGRHFETADPAGAWEPCPSPPVSAAAPDERKALYVDIANRAQEITGRGIWPSTVKAVLEVAASVSAAAPDERVEVEQERDDRRAWMRAALDLQAKVRQERARAEVAEAALAALREQYRDLATYRTTHANLGLCPEGPDDPARDPDCPVCAALGAAPSETEEGR